jgi:hypothetical protein
VKEAGLKKLLMYESKYVMFWRQNYRDYFKRPVFVKVLRGGRGMIRR